MTRLTFAEIDVLLKAIGEGPLKVVFSKAVSKWQGKNALLRALKRSEGRVTKDSAGNWKGTFSFRGRQFEFQFIQPGNSRTGSLLKIDIRPD